MTQHVARVHPVYLMNVERRHAAQDKARRPGCEFACAGCQRLHPPSPFVMITHFILSFTFYCFCLFLVQRQYDIRILFVMKKLSFGSGFFSDNKGEKHP